MKKNIVKKLNLVLLSLVTLFSLSFTTSLKAKQTKEGRLNNINSKSFTNYRLAKAGSTFASGTAYESVNCADALILVVANSNDELTTGTHVWVNPARTIPVPNGIITSQSGSTYGLSFYVTNGVIGEEAVPC